MKKDVLTWEAIDGLHTRAKIFGGWLVKAYEHTNNVGLDGGCFIREQSEDLRMSMTFVPDANHLWELSCK